MAFCTVLSASVQGLGVEMIRVEADVSNGLPMFHMVGIGTGDRNRGIKPGRENKRCAGSSADGDRSEGAGM